VTVVPPFADNAGPVSARARRHGRLPLARRIVAVVTLAIWCTACASAPSPKPAIRGGTEEEKQRLAQALAPLLIALDYPTERGPAGLRLAGDCRIGLAVLATPAINASVGPGRKEPCQLFQLLVTEGAVRDLEPRELRGVLAHELAHVHLGHFARAEERRRVEDARRKRTATMEEVLSYIPGLGAPALIALLGVEAVSSGASELSRRAFSREDEAEADRFAVALLKRAEPTNGGFACLGLADVLERLHRARAARAAEWLSTHPSPERRAQIVRAECER
jgi:Peptidase family M48